MVDASVEQRGGELLQRAGAGERIARDCGVVVSADDVRIESAEQLVEAGTGAGMRQQVAGDHDELGPPGAHPLDGAVDGDGAARRSAEMEVREVGDAQAVEPVRQVRDGHSSTRVRSQPASNQPYAMTGAATAPMINSAVSIGRPRSRLPGAWLSVRGRRG